VLTADVLCSLHFFVVQHEINGYESLMSVNDSTNHQAAPLTQVMTSSSYLQTKHATRTDAVPPVWCSTADDLVNADDFRLAVMKNDLKLIETFLKYGKCFFTFFDVMQVIGRRQ